MCSRRRGKAKAAAMHVRMSVLCVLSVGVGCLSIGPAFPQLAYFVFAEMAEFDDSTYGDCCCAVFLLWRIPPVLFVFGLVDAHVNRHPTSLAILSPLCCRRDSAGVEGTAQTLSSQQTVRALARTTAPATLPRHAGASLRCRSTQPTLLPLTDTSDATPIPKAAVRWSGRRSRPT